MAIAKPATSSKVTFEDYLDRDGTVHAEWVDGEVVPLSPVSLHHELLLRFLSDILGPYVRELDLGTMLGEPFVMRLDTTRTGRQPDLLFVARGHEDRMKRTYLDGPADLAIEIVSIESRQRDRVTKYGEYERAGVREYWILDADAETADFHQLGEDGRYRAVPADEAGIYRSAVVEGLWIEVKWLWERPRPYDVARAWGLVR